MGTHRGPGNIAAEIITKLKRQNNKVTETTGLSEASEAIRLEKTDLVIVVTEEKIIACPGNVEVLRMLLADTCGYVN
ncbi:MAG: hypothetical protein PHG66_05685 [Candidatus Colwellbacteria bacterium]|nr:hypothetical protein [Candidatus Colwellbacteria bacterium]